MYHLKIDGEKTFESVQECLYEKIMDPIRKLVWKARSNMELCQSALDIQKGNDHCAFP